MIAHRWFLFGFFLALILLCSAPVRGEESLKTAASIANDLFRGNFSAVEAYFSPQLREAMPRDRLVRMREDLMRRGGDLRYIQAAVPEGVANGELPYRRAVVPVDLEGFSIELLLTWQGELGSGTLHGLAVRPVSGRAAVSRRNGAPLTRHDASYIAPERFIEESVEIGVEHFPLEAILSVPIVAREGRRLPAVILLPDRAMSDADGTLGGTAILRDLAQGLASRGVVTLRFPRRLSIYTELQLRRYTIEEDLLADARTAAELLLRRPEVDPGRLYIAGHGTGAYLAPVLAARGPASRGLILLSPLAEWDASRQLEILETEGVIGPQLGESEYRSLQGSLHFLQDGGLAPDFRFHDTPAAYWYSLRGIDPPALVGQFRGRTLLVFGGRDHLIDQREYERWGKLAAESGRVTLEYLPALNRWMIFSRGDGGPDELQIPGHLNPQVVDLVYRFVSSR